MKKLKCALIISLSILLILSNQNITTLSYSNEVNENNINTIEFKENNDQVLSTELNIENNINSKARITQQPTNYESNIETCFIIVAFGVFSFFTLRKKKVEHI